MAAPTSLCPKAVRHIVNGCNHLAEAFEVGCEGINKTTKGVSNLSSLVLKQQHDRLAKELANT
jgi:hypothetical protein